MHRDLPILLVEDDDVDVENVTRAFEENGIANPLYVAHHGEIALTMLREGAPDQGHPLPLRPGLILLDINMPIMNGIELLGHLKQDPELCTIPVVVLTTSQEESDRYESFRHSVAGYIIKPVEFNDFVAVVDVVDRYWSLSETAS
jgi:CheY-like chemotaxis protein